jgi:5-dehydro-2-deoxygluconokinase
VASRLECSTAMPSADEVAALAELTATEAVNV